MDGSTLDVLDSPANAEVFGCSGSSLGASANPQIRFVSRLETGTNAPFAAQFGPYATGDTTLARELLKNLEPEMLLLADRRSFGYDLFAQAAGMVADFLFRVRTNQLLPVEHRLKVGSCLSRIYPRPNEQRKQEGGLVVRVIKCQIEGKDENYRLVATITNPSDAPAVELAHPYHERWEIEVANDEIKTHLEGSHLPLRSKTPEPVGQEFWGLMTCL